ncbi:response regulator [Chryseobacterium wanjuense]
MSISIAIVEDEKNYNNALKKVINYQDDMKVVAQFFDGNEALKNLSDISPDVVMMDIQLQDMLGIEIIEKLKRKCRRLSLSCVRVLKKTTKFSIL